MRNTLAALPLSAALTLGLAACVETAAPTTGTCPADELQGLIGQHRSVLDAVDYEPMRVAGPDEAVTMDYNAERLDIRVDAAGRIVSLICG